MKSKIEIGRFYANDFIYEDGKAEKNIILVVSKNNLEGSFKTETLWITDGKIGDLYSNDWLSEFLQRKATLEEINLFNQERSEIDGSLKGYGEAVTRVRIG